MSNGVPNVQSVDASEAALNALQGQLDRHLAGIDGMDQKAALLPPALGAVGVLGLVPTSGAHGVSLIFAVLGVVAALIAFLMCFATLMVVKVAVGADPDLVAAGASLPPAKFNLGMCRSVAGAIREVTTVEFKKARTLNIAFAATAAAIFFWVVSHASAG